MHEYIHAYTFDCEETTHIHDYIRCMRLDITQYYSVRLYAYTKIETPTVLLENTLPSVRIIPPPICSCLYNSFFIPTLYFTQPHPPSLSLALCCFPSKFFSIRCFFIIITIQIIVIVSVVGCLLALQLHSWSIRK